MMNKAIELWTAIAQGVMAEAHQVRSARVCVIDLPEGKLRLEYKGFERGVNIFEYEIRGKRGRIAAKSQWDLVEKIQLKRKAGFIEESTLRLQRLLRSMKR